MAFSSQIFIIFIIVFIILRAGIAQSVQQLATRWTFWGSNPGGVGFSAPVQTGPGAHPASLSQGYSGWGLVLTTHPYLVPRLKYTAIHLFCFWYFMACSRVIFTFCPLETGTSVTSGFSDVQCSKVISVKSVIIFLINADSFVPDQ